MTQRTALAKKMKLEDDDGLDELLDAVPPSVGRLAVMIRKAREKKGLSQRNLAELAKVNHELVRRIEAGQCDPKWSVGVHIARVLNLHNNPDFIKTIMYGQIGANRVQQGE